VGGGRRAEQHIKHPQKVPAKIPAGDQGLRTAAAFRLGRHFHGKAGRQGIGCRFRDAGTVATGLAKTLSVRLRAVISAKACRPAREAVSPYFDGPFRSAGQGLGGKASTGRSR